jgi:hypothetical protein
MNLSLSLDAGKGVIGVANNLQCQRFMLFATQLTQAYKHNLEKYFVDYVFSVISAVKINSVEKLAD